MPFAQSLKEIYTEVYASVCAEREIQCTRVDEIARPGSITRDIIEGILDSDLIVADLSGRNANVFYELGIAHTCGNKTIMTSQDIVDVPFDIRNYRIILYDHSLTGCRKLAADLGKATNILDWKSRSDPISSVKNEWIEICLAVVEILVFQSFQFITNVISPRGQHHFYDHFKNPTREYCLIQNACR